MVDLYTSAEKGASGRQYRDLEKPIARVLRYLFAMPSGEALLKAGVLSLRFWRRNRLR